MAALPSNSGLPFNDLHVVCYHGLGDAIRYAFPLALALGHAGKRCYLHTRAGLAECIGRQPLLAAVAGADDDFVFKSFSGAEAAAAAYFEPWRREAGGVVILGSSVFDAAVEGCVRRAGIPCWGRAGASASGLPPSNTWFDTPEYYHDVQDLCRLFGVESLPRSEMMMHPLESEKPAAQPKNEKARIGVHCLSNWPARSYPHRERLLDILRQEFDVWNYDDPPCQSISRLAWIIRSSAAVLTIDSMVLHLARALGVLTLNIQGPVWKHPDEAPFFIPGTRISQEAVPLSAIDRNASPLSVFPSEFIAEEFTQFLHAADRSRWQAVTLFVGETPEGKGR